MDSDDRFAVIYDWFERLSPLALGVLSGGSFFYFYDKIPIPSADKLLQVIQAGLTVSAIIVGFLVTAKSILLSIAGSRRLSFIREAGQGKRLIDYFIESIVAFTITAFFSIGLLVFDFSQQSQLKEIFLSAGIFLFVWDALTAIRVLIFYSIIVRDAFS